MTQAKPISLTRHVARRVKELRNRRGWSAQRLGEEMTGVGIPWDRSVVANLESGRRAGLSIEELLALAYVLDVAPVHLLVPTDAESLDESFYPVTPEDSFRLDEVRAWIRGQQPLVGQDPRLYFAEVPVAEHVPPAWSETDIERESAQVRRGRDAG